MGNWRDRPRRFRRPKSPPPPKDYAPELLELWQDGIPLWEKKFCVGVGSVPWRKIVDTKKLMFFHSNVVNWDDSAAEEAFHSAKRRYWAEINGADCGISLPDHDLYIDEIDWNPTIDSELIENLDLARYAPGEEESHDKFESENNNGTSVSVPSEEHSRNADNAENPWECSIKQGSTLLKNNVEGWNTWNDKVTDGNPWEQGFKGSGRIKNDSWGDCLKSGNELNNWRSPGSHVNHFDNHVVSVKDEVWGDSRNNMGGQSSSHSFSQNKRTPKEREWLNSEEHSCGWKHRKNEELRRREGWGASKNGYPRREFSHQNEYNYYRQQRDDYQTAQCRRRGLPQKHSILPLSTGDRYV